jgi:hypothetical protein
MKQYGSVPLVPAHRQAHWDYGREFGRDTEGGKVFADWTADARLWRWKLSGKGDDPSQWPTSMRVQQFPTR